MLARLCAMYTVTSLENITVLWGRQKHKWKIIRNVEKFYEISKKKEVSAPLVAEGQGCQESFLEEVIFELDCQGYNFSRKEK